VSLLAGCALALVLLVAWSCKTTRTGFLPMNHTAGSVDISSIEGVGSRPEPMIRVRIANQSKGIELAGRGPWLIAVAGARSGEVLQGPVMIQASKGGIRLTDRGGSVRGFGPETVVYAGPVVGPNEKSGQEIVSVGRTRYPGTLRLHPRPDVGGDVFDVVSVVEIERYIPGVIAKELLPHWDEKAFMAQAVAARTFALSRRESARSSDRWYDVDDSSFDQVYGGLTGLRVAIRAAEATRGVVLTESGRLAGAYYSSTCGGKPALAEQIWPSNIPAIQNVAFNTEPIPHNTYGRDVLCDSAPLYEWEIARRTGELGDRIRAWAKKNDHEIRKLGTLSDIVVSQKSANGRALIFVLTDTNRRSATITAERLRAACNSSQRGLSDVSSIAMLHSGDVSFDVGKRVTRVKGNGFGHGVGLCQYCAQAMASRGDDWRLLLESFYPDADLIRIY
jgi:stage II sporulation protein D